jgi:hypothetical protein
MKALNSQKENRMKTSVTTVISINYAGMQLPVLKNEQGEDCTPLKPIVDLFGVQWEGQRKKVTSNPFLTDFLGTCTLSGWGAGPQNREQICILLSRVAAFMMSINPELVRVKGNESAAKFLKQKIEEWADVLHDYEELGIAVNLNSIKAQESLRKQRAAFAQMIGVKSRASDLTDRQALSKVIGQMAGELGISYQFDLID